MQIPRRLGPKRASKIRKLFNLSKEDDVRTYVIKRPLPQKEGKKQRFKAPKIQRLITPVMLQVILLNIFHRIYKRHNQAADFRHIDISVFNWCGKVKLR